MKKLLIATSLLTSLCFISCEKESNETILIASEAPNNAASIDALQEKTNWTTIFRDDFNPGSTISNNWEITNRADYNSSRCMYSSDRVSLGSIDGASCLQLEAIDDASRAGYFLSGHVKSRQRFEPGVNEQIHVASRIKLIARQGNGYRSFSETSHAWPALWTTNEEVWPRKGEIDIMEGYSRGGSSDFASNLFYGVNSLQDQINGNALREYDGFNVDSNSGWHTYDMYWTNVNGAVYVDIFVDGDQVANYGNFVDNDLRLQDFDDHSVIVNLNVGSDGGIFSGNSNLFSRTQMFVDYVLVRRKNI